MDKTSIVYKYTIGRYGDEATARRIAEQQKVPFEIFCANFYRESTGVGEYRNPEELSSSELVRYTPPIEKKKNESIGDYRLRQLDYWFKNVELTENGLIWKKPVV